jgi:hypothetical protein
LCDTEQLQIGGQTVGANSQRKSASDEEDAYESSQKDAVRADLSRRLKKICSNLSDEDFDALVDRMAEKKIMGDRRTSL